MPQKPDQTYTTRLSGKAGLVEETFLAFDLIAQGVDLEQLREAMIEQDTLGKATVGTRKAIWDKLHQRYFSEWEKAEQLAKLFTAGNGNLKRLLLYYVFAKNETVLYDAVVCPIWKRFENGYSGVEIGDLQAWLDSVAQNHPEIEGWSPQTRKKVLSNVLTVLKDFGLMSGKFRKGFETIYLPLPVLGFVLYSLKAEMEAWGPQNVISHPDWKLFFKDEEDVIALLDEASAEGYCTFKRQGSVMTLSLTWENVGGFVEAITGKV